MRPVKWLSSPNFASRNDTKINLLVLHYTGMKTCDEALTRLCDVQAQVSAHYVVDEDGQVYQLVDEDQRAWHAGLSLWRGIRNVNPSSIGIEIVNPGHEFGYRPFPEAQMEAVAELSAGICKRHAIEARNVVGHSDVAPGRKEDPGELFDWKFLADAGVGVWPEIKAKDAMGREPRNIEKMQQDLAAYGYDVQQNGVSDELTRKVVIAFQRHFRQKNITGNWDRECEELLNLLKQLISRY